MMSRYLEEHVLPTYSDATSQDHWKLIAPYIASSDLCNAALACSRWHEIFAPQLWGNPASHFGTEDDSVYVALTHFRRTLPWARLYVRQMTHTLHMPPAHAELYEGPHAEWLRDMLQRLPRLQCLVVDSLPFFDHGCLMAMRAPLVVREGSAAHQMATKLRLLNASRCSNATYSGLAAALKQFPNLLWLDLSYTTAVRHHSVLEALNCMRELLVLKLSGTGLKDDDLAILARAIGITVRSLDVSKNSLTDRCAGDLLTHCFRKSQNNGLSQNARGTPLAHGEESLRQYLGEDFSEDLQARLMGDFADRLSVQDDYQPGLTHLYIANNELSVEGVASFVLTGRLQCLDAGTVATPRVKANNSLSANIQARMPGAEKLMNTIKAVPPEQMACLRINHEFITRHAPNPASNAEHPSELPGTVPHAEPGSAPELDGAPVLEISTPETQAELDSETLHELEAGQNGRQRAISTATQQTSDTNVTSQQTNGNVQQSPMVSNSAADVGRSESGDLLRPPLERARRYSGLVEARVARAAHQRAYADTYTPILTPRLQTLVLCDVPSQTSDQSIPARIKQLISDCAKEHSLACSEARANYACPPGANRIAFERLYIRSVFPLRRIVLEIADPSSSSAKAKPSSSWRQQPTSKASTVDPDSESFWDAAQQDFTFFADEECGQPLDLAPSAPSWFMDPIPVNDSTASRPTRSSAPKKDAEKLPDESMIDVVAEVSKFRQNRRAAKQTRVAAGYPDEDVDGFWEGVLQVKRPHRGAPSGIARDYYGNVYEKGFRYR